MVDLTLKELKEIVYKRAAEHLNLCGFKGIKTRMEFIRKTKEQEVLIAFGFNNYAPIDYEFSYVSLIKYPELIQALQAFYSTVDPKRPARFNIFLQEGYFIDRIANETSLKKNTFKNSVISRVQGEGVIDESLNILVNKMLVFADKLDTLQKYQEFVISNPSYLKEHIGFEFYLSALLAANMKSKLEYKKLNEVIETFLIEEKKNGRNFKMELNYVEKLRLYLQ